MRFRPQHDRPASAARTLALACLALAWLASPQALQASCVDSPSGTATKAIDPNVSRGAAQRLVAEALSRSAAVGAARMTADAALHDTDEARAARRLQVSANAGFGPAAVRADGSTSSTLAQARAGLSLSQLIADGGRTDRVVDWRDRLAEAARLGWIGSQEQVALNTVSLALERSRYLQQAEVYAQYVGQMDCLVGSLRQVVDADRGRLSELVQARKSMSQAELSQEQAASQGRQAEGKLRRMAGDALPDADALLGLLLQVPDLGPLQADVLRSTEIAQLDAQAEAARQKSNAISQRIATALPDVGAAQPVAQADYSLFYDQLAPMGRWFEVNGYGYCWRPTITVVGWRPYVAWYGDMDLMPHLKRLLGLGWITCEITFHPPVSAEDFPDRKAMAAHCEQITRDGFARLLAGRETA